MAIERMKSVWLFAPRGRARETLDRLARMGLCHVADCGPPESDEAEAPAIHRPEPVSGELERRVQLLREVFDTLSPFHKTAREFLENFISTPVEVANADVRRALDDVDVEQIHAEVKQMEQAYNMAMGALQKAQAALMAVAALRGVPGTVPGRKDQQRTAAFLGVMSELKFDALRGDERAPDTCALGMVARYKKQMVVQAACMAKERETLAGILRDHGFATVEPEDRTVTVDEYLGHLRDDVERCEEAVAETKAKLVEAAVAKKKDVEITLGYWEERLRTASAVSKLAESKRLTILRGYVRARELEEFRRRVSEELPAVGVEVREPTPDEPVPVSLRNPKLLAPAQFLISMLGMPNYFTFDPTPFVFFNFVIFFGICFGDLAYGFGLIAMGFLLARKYKEYPGLRHLFTLLGYAGITTAIVGVLTGSWAGNLFSPDWFGSPNPFFSPSNPLLVLNAKWAQMDLLQRLIIALVLALAIGIVNQMIGMICLMISNIKKRDPLGAVLDSIFWLILMPALVVLVTTMFSSGLPPSAVKVAWGAVAVSVAGLVLTQGRAQKNIVARLGLGVVSLYGVVGTYGCSAFLSDTLSYSRLLALGLVTGIIGMCFNIMADLARGIPWLGIPLALLILVGGHAANFMLSILGSFVHSARLIFVEFFGRFYQGDAPTFAPLGTWSGRVRVTDARTVWAD